ncbi:MAG TPA: polysaccharide deacetylase family protein [Pyrinomonadaceae bacterium]|nr:polysaccharide deacetylase family protein [Pyrinomonadaceae bacterium]
MSLVKQLVIKGLSQRVLPGPSKRFIFVYHDVSDPNALQYSKLYSTRPEAFREQINFFADHFTFDSLDDIISRDVNGGDRPRAAVTFDDGFLSVREIAFPYLAKNGIPFTVFANRNAIASNTLANGMNQDVGASGKKIFLDQDDIRFLHAEGVTIGSHGASHRMLLDCDDATLRDEIDGNKNYLENLIGSSVLHIALPFGKREHYDQRVLDRCFQAGHRYVYSSNPTYFDTSSDAYKTRLIPRIGVLNDTPAELTFLINRPLVKTINI